MLIFNMPVTTRMLITSMHTSMLINMIVGSTLGNLLRRIPRLTISVHTTVRTRKLMGMPTSLDTSLFFRMHTNMLTTMPIRDDHQCACHQHHYFLATYAPAAIKSMINIRMFTIRLQINVLISMLIVRVHVCLCGCGRVRMRVRAHGARACKNACAGLRRDLQRGAPLPRCRL